VGEGCVRLFVLVVIFGILFSYFMNAGRQAIGN
jgi:hypothetical protein